MRNLYVALIALLLSACAPLNISPDYSLTDKEGKGVLVMSMTYTPDQPTFQLVFRPVGTTETNSLLSNSVPHPEDWKNPAGRLVVTELPAGKYEIFQWAGGHLESIRPFLIPFTVTQGKATYVGNVHVDVLQQLRTFKISVTDKSDRDIPLLRSRFKNIKESDITKSIATVN